MVVIPRYFVEHKKPILSHIAIYFCWGLKRWYHQIFEPLRYHHFFSARMFHHFGKRQLTPKARRPVSATPDPQVYPTILRRGDTNDLVSPRSEDVTLLHAGVTLDGALMLVIRDWINVLHLSRFHEDERASATSYRALRLVSQF